MRTAPVVVVLLVLATATACGSGNGGGSAGASDDGAGGDSALTVTVVDAPGAAARTWTLTCDPPGGTHPDPAQACAALDAAQDPFSPVPPDQACTAIYGGPQTATLTGTWRGQRVDASYARTDGCEISRWKALGVVFGSPGT